MKKNKGFTLVELLAVIVILAIIMIIAIPAVLETLETARKKTFFEFCMKVNNNFQQKWLEDKELNGIIPSDTVEIYYSFDDLGLNNTGNYHGMVVVYYASDSYFLTPKTKSYMSSIKNGIYYDVSIVDTSSNYKFYWFGSFTDSFPSDFKDVSIFDNTQSMSDFYESNSYYPDATILINSDVSSYDEDYYDKIANEEIESRQGIDGLFYKRSELD